MRVSPSRQCLGATVVQFAIWAICSSSRIGKAMEWSVCSMSLFSHRVGRRAYQLKRALSWATRPPLVLVKRPKDELVMSVEAKLVRLV